MCYDAQDYIALRKRTRQILEEQEWYTGVSATHFYYRAARECWEVVIYFEDGREMELLVDPTMNKATLAALVENNYQLYKAHWSEDES